MPFEKAATNEVRDVTGEAIRGARRTNAERSAGSIQP